MDSFVPAAATYARKGIRINAIAAGLVDTPLASKSPLPNGRWSIQEHAPLGQN